MTPEGALALASHTRRFLWATLGVVIPLGILLVLFPSQTGVFWMWGMRDPRSAILVGSVYVGATVYYLLAVRSDDWLETQAGLEGIFMVSAALLLAVVFHWDVVRFWHPMTLVWMPAYYVPLFFVPYLFRLEGGWARLPGGEQVRIPDRAAVWLTVRGFLYAALAAVGFVFAGPASRAWPWAIDPVEVRMFLGQPATFILPALAVLRGNVLWRRHRLPLVYLGALGIVQLAGMLVLTTPYRWTSPLGVLLPLMFCEWVITPLATLGRRGTAAPSPGADALGPPIVPPSPSAVQYGVMVLGVAYLVIGVVGFLPIGAINPPTGSATYLLRHIAVNDLHNLVHVLIGITGLAASRQVWLTRLWGKTVGAVLLALFLAGVVQAALAGFPRDQALLGLVVLNSAGHVFHFATGVIALIFGFGGARVGSFDPAGGEGGTSRGSGLPPVESVWDYPRPPRVEPTPRRIRVVFAGIPLADTRRALRVLETSSPPSYYIPIEDVRMEHLAPTRHQTTCEFKGIASYWTVRVGDRAAENAAWSYQHATPGYEALRDHVAFYAGKMDACYVGDERVRPQPGDYYGGWITADVRGPFKGEPAGDERDRAVRRKTGR